MARIRVAAVQSGVDPAWSPSEWANHLRWQLATCRDAGAELVVFPAWTGVYQESFPRGFPEEALGTLVRLLGDLAGEAGVYLVPGSVPVRCHDGIRLRGFLLSPTGDLLGTQDQLLPPPGYASGRNLTIFATPLGRLALILGADCQVPEIGRILALLGADLFCAPSALLAPPNQWQQIAGLWQIAQANQVAAVEACLVGTLNGLAYAGRSQLLGPVEMTADGRGILAEAATAGGTEVVVGTVDLSALAKARDAFPIFAGFNLDLYRNRLMAAWMKLDRALPPPAGIPPTGEPPQEVGEDEHE